jgi:two-component system sensor histidine kinase PilS (NtrC family)
MESGLSREESRAAVEAQNWKLLGFFNYYRLAIALAAVGISFFAPAIPPFGSRTPGLFQAAAIIYAALGTAGLLTIRERRFNFETHTTLLTFADIVLLTVLMHASGGLGSGLGLLLVVAIGGGSLLLSRLITIFYASLASIAVILEHSWDYLTGNVTSLAGLSQDYPQVGMLGIGFFVTAFLGYTLAERLRATEAIAERRGVDLANLTQVNALVIQHMQIGVLVCDADGHVRLGNQAAQKFLGQALASGKLSPLTAVSPDLAIQLFRWLGEGQSGGRGRSVFTTRAGYTVLPRFVALGEDKAAGALIFLEDMAVLKQQAQQLKMASLARLTASIAHEIRNPLGALANAAQLLGEAAQPSDQEKRLIKIIGDQSQRMNVIVENVTQLSRRDHVSPARFALGPWLGEFTRQYADTARVAHGIFTPSERADGVEVCMDPEQLYQVVSNLCQNALRHSPPFTGTPLIRLDTGHDPEQRPYLDVIDWGAGVAPDIVDFIFDPFFTTTPKGTGLGLYIAKEMCEGNGATLEYHAGEGKVGSRFRVTFARPEDCLEFGTV